mgnify:FL=1
MDNDKRFQTQDWDTDAVHQRIINEVEAASAPTPKKKRRKGKFNWKIYVAAVVLGSMLLAGIGWILANDLCALDKGDETYTVTIEEGDGVFKIAPKLKKAGLIELKGFFVLYEIFTGAKNDIDPGTYELNTSMDYRSLVHNMYDPDARRRAEEGLVLVTIPEGYSVQQIVDLLAEKGIATKEELVDAVSNFGEEYPFIDNSLTGQINRLEGYLFPDTYEFSTKKTAVFAIDTMLTNFNTKVSNELLSEIQESGYTFREIITMASIIEKEAIGDYEERTNVASVLYNRLNNPDAETAGLLQVDASIDYALRLEGKDRSEFSTELDSPYNTYIHAGLPVGPICNPSLASIRAALNPSQTDYYYYALGTDGVHHFFRTYSEHLAFVNSDMYAPA